jgi:hypothetical protein
MMSCVSLIEFGNKHKQLFVTDRQEHAYIHTTFFTAQHGLGQTYMHLLFDVH